MSQFVHTHPNGHGYSKQGSVLSAVTMILLLSGLPCRHAVPRLRPALRSFLTLNNVNEDLGCGAFYYTLA